MGLKEMDSMITIQIDTLKKFRDASVPTKKDNIRLIDKRNSVNTNSIFTGKHTHQMDPHLVANNNINQGLNVDNPPANTYEPPPSEVIKEEPEKEEEDSDE
jgi:hypothetical protein